MRRQLQTYFPLHKWPLVILSYLHVAGPGNDRSAKATQKKGDASGSRFRFGGTRPFFQAGEIKMKTWMAVRFGNCIHSDSGTVSSTPRWAWPRDHCCCFRRWAANCCHVTAGLTTTPPPSGAWCAGALSASSSPDRTGAAAKATWTLSMSAERMTS